MLPRAPFVFILKGLARLENYDTQKNYWQAASSPSVFWIAGLSSFCKHATELSTWSYMLPILITADMVRQSMGHKCQCTHTFLSHESTITSNQHLTSVPFPNWNPHPRDVQDAWGSAHQPFQSPVWGHTQAKDTTQAGRPPKAGRQEPKRQVKDSSRTHAISY